MSDAKNGFLGGLELAQENVTTAGPVMFQLLPRTAALPWGQSRGQASLQFSSHYHPCYDNQRL